MDNPGFNDMLGVMPKRRSHQDSNVITSDIDRLFKEKVDKELIHGMIELTSGAAGATVSVLVTNPAEMVKTKLRVYPGDYEGTMDCFLKQVRKYGIRGLYSGAGSSLLAEVTDKGILFTAYGLCKDTQKTDEQLTLSQKAFSGLVAAFFSSLALCPVDLIKTKQQAAHKFGRDRSTVSLFRVAKTILRVEGVRGLYHGLVATLIRDMPGYYVYFGSYEATKQFFTKGDKKKKMIAFSGCVAGAASCAITHPIDTAKTQVQVKSSNTPVLVLIMETFSKSGFSGLMRGLSSSLIRSIPATGCLFVAYENTKHLLKKKVEKYHPHLLV